MIGSQRKLCIETLPEKAIKRSEPRIPRSTGTTETQKDLDGLMNNLDSFSLVGSQWREPLENRFLFEKKMFSGVHGANTGLTLGF